MIDLADGECQNLVRELRTVVLRLTLVSHVSAMNLEPSSPSTDEDIGGKCPGGRLDGFGDRQDEYRQKTALHFQRRLDRWDRDGYYHGPDHMRVLLREAEAAVEAWQKTPLIAGTRPASMADPRWKQWVGACDHSVADLWRWYGCTRQHIYKIRKDYREETLA